ncbi:GLIPR1-like protein 1 isoform X2 [Ciona intestinalis]
MVTLRIAITFLFFNLVTAPATEFSKEECDEILQQHNILRAQVRPPAGNMEKMAWDDRLAEMAQNWANECNFEHGRNWKDDQIPYTFVGQNIWMGTKTQSRRLTLLIVQDWWDEINYYTYENNTCEEWKICGHYLQVATAESVFVGCGWKDCTEERIRALIVVCEYQRPPSNPALPLPYKAGEWCSLCKSGEGWCDDGLCAECISPIHEHYWPTNPNKITKSDCQHEKLGTCDDSKPDCTRMLPPGARTTTCHPSQEGLCKKTCGMCEGLYNDSVGLCCGGLICVSGGRIDTDSCECVCPAPFYGTRCERSRAEVRPERKVHAMILLAALTSFICL